VPEKQKSSRVRDLLFTLLGTILGTGVSYLSGLDQKRLELLRGTQRDAYVAFLTAQASADLGANPDDYAAKTTDARKRIAIYGSSEVVEALAKYWRSHFDRPSCGGGKERVRDDVAIFMSMRRDLTPFWQQVSEADMMMLMYLCQISK
jgi:hypothetical protein